MSFFKSFCKPKEPVWVVMKNKVPVYHKEMQERLDIFNSFEGYMKKFRFRKLTFGFVSNILFRQDAIRFFEKLLEKQIAHDDVELICLENYVNGQSVWPATKVNGLPQRRWHIWFYHGYYVRLGYGLTECEFGYIHPQVFERAQSLKEYCFVGCHQGTFSQWNFYLSYEIRGDKLYLYGLEAEKIYICFKNYDSCDVLPEQLEFDVKWYVRFGR